MFGMRPDPVVNNISEIFNVPEKFKDECGRIMSEIREPMVKYCRLHNTNGGHLYPNYIYYKIAEMLEITEMKDKIYNDIKSYNNQYNNQYHHFTVKEYLSIHDLIWEKICREKGYRFKETKPFI